MSVSSRYAPQAAAILTTVLLPVIDCLGGTDPELGQTTFASAVEYAKANRPHDMGAASPKLTYIHTGGTWVFAQGPNKWVDERREPGFEVKLTAWRKEMETKVLTSE